MRNPAATDRLFFALYPDAQTAARVAALGTGLAARHGLRGRLHRPERLHVTLHMLGDFVGLPAREHALALEAAAAVRFEPFEFALDRLLSFDRRGGRNRPCVLGGGPGAEPVCAFRRALCAELQRVGLPLEARPYRPHLTLCYADSLVPEQVLDAPVGWRVGEFRLMDSLLGRARHEMLARFELNPTPETPICVLP